MKISELTTDRGLDVLVEITPYVKRLANCESLINLYSDIGNMSEEERDEDGFAAKILEKLVPVWLKDCREELIAIIRSIDGVSEEEMQKLGAVRTFERMSALFNDPDFVGFFKSFVVIKKNPTE